MSNLYDNIRSQGVQCVNPQLPQVIFTVSTPGMKVDLEPSRHI